MQENRKKNIENSRQNSHNEKKGKRAPALGKGRRGGQKEIGRESDMDLKESEKGVLEMGSVLDEMREEYEGYGRAEGLEEGMRKGIRKGRRVGRRENASMVAQRMLDAGKYSIREVAHISGLSRMEVRRLAMGRGHRNSSRNPSRK